VKTGIQTPSLRRQGTIQFKTGFLLEFIPMKIGAGMTNPLNALFAVVFQKAKLIPEKI
jgi:hypothetical protein